MKNKRNSRADSVYDSIDADIINHLLKKKYAILELSEAVGLAHQHLKKHLVKLYYYDLINIEQKDKKIEISLKVPEANLTMALGYIMIQAAKNGKKFFDNIKSKQPQKNNYNTIASLS